MAQFIPCSKIVEAAFADFNCAITASMASRASMQRSSNAIWKLVELAFVGEDDRIFTYCAILVQDDNEEIAAAVMARIGWRRARGWRHHL